MTTVIKAEALERMKKIDGVVTSALRETIKHRDSPFAVAAIQANAVSMLRAQLTEDLMVGFSKLANSKLGFLTDRPNKRQEYPYSPAELRDCLIEALLRGVMPTGNQFNVLGGNCYITSEGWQHLVRRLPGVTGVDCVALGDPEVKGGTAAVSMRLIWYEDGKRDTHVFGDSKTEGDTRLRVRVNAGMGLDAILGKAKARAFKWLHTNITGQSYDSVDDVAVETEPHAAVTEERDQLERDADALFGAEFDREPSGSSAYPD